MYEYEDLECVLYIKSLLIAEDCDEFIKTIKSKDEFQACLYYIIQIYNKETPFFLMSEHTVFNMINNVFDFINAFRFQYKDPDLIQACNEMIGALNKLKTADEKLKRMDLQQYLMYQEDIRGLDFDGNFNELAVSMSIDHGIYEDYMEDVYATGFKDYSLVYGSINYFLNSFDESYNDLKLMDSINKNLDILKKNSRQYRLKKNVKYLKREINKSIKFEEYE